MPVKYSVVDGGRLVVVRWVGAITRRELVAHLKALAADERLVPGAVQFSDLRQAWLPRMGLDDLQQLFSGSRHPTRKLALLIKAESWPQVRAAEVEVEHPDIEVACFNMLNHDQEIPAACTWLRVDPELVEAELARLTFS